jgi:hypothetical protein
MDKLPTHTRAYSDYLIIWFGFFSNKLTCWSIIRESWIVAIKEGRCMSWKNNYFVAKPFLLIVEIILFEKKKENWKKVLSKVG